MIKYTREYVLFCFSRLINYIIIEYYFMKLEEIQLMYIYYKGRKVLSDYYTWNIIEVKKFARELNIYLPYDELIYIGQIGKYDVINLPHNENKDYNEHFRFFVHFNEVEWNDKEKKCIKYLYHLIFNYKIIVLTNGNLILEEDYKIKL